MTAAMWQVREWPSRYELIDGLRGLAALGVVLTHLRIVAPDVGHCAVMLFFVISGYCIAASAQTCRRNGVSFGTFMWRRVHRIYPPYFFAIIFYVLTRLAKAGFGGHNDLARPWLDWVMNLTMTQWLWLPFHPVADAPQNPKLLVAAFWSLNYEDQFYLVMALAVLLAVRRRISMSVVIVVLGVLGLCWNFTWPAGWITGFFIEYWLHFCLGALLFHVLCVFRSRLACWITLSCIAVLNVFCLWRIIPWESGVLLHERVYVELAVASSFTLILFALRPFSATVSGLQIWRPVAALGVISYSLYLTNQFNLTLVESTVNRIAANAWEPVKVILMLVLQVLVATVFWYLCERPFLNRSARDKASQPLARPDSARPEAASG